MRFLHLPVGKVAGRTRSSLIRLLPTTAPSADGGNPSGRFGSLASCRVAWKTTRSLTHTPLIKATAPLPFGGVEDTLYSISSVNRGGAPVHARRAAGLSRCPPAIEEHKEESTMPTRRSLLVLAATVALVVAGPVCARVKSIVVASTTSTQDSGLFGHILPLFKAKTGIDVKVLAQGTGQALNTARRGDADVVFVHAREAEEKFIAEGFGVKRYSVMYNDFIIVGPKDDPASIKGARNVAFALQTIKAKGAPFISRGDNSGTHIAEINLWKSIGVDIKKEAGPWYKSIGQGMGAALNVAAASGGYTMSDRGTWVSFKNKADLVIAVEGDKLLFNQYGVILVNPAKHPHVKKELGQQFTDGLISNEGQKAIADYKVNGEQLFWPQRE